LGHQFGGLLRQPLFANAGYLWAVTLVGSLAGFVFWGLAARLYAPGNIGIASAVISAAALLAGLAGLGLGTGLVRFLPGVGDPSRLLNSALSFSALAALFVAVIYLAGLDLWSPSLSFLRSSILYLAGFVAFTIAQTLGAVIQMAFVARRRAGYALARTGIVNGGRLLLVVPLVGLGAAGLVGSQALAVVVSVALSLALFLPRVEPGYRLGLRLHRPDLAAILPYSLGNYLAGLLAQTSQMVLPLLILEVLGPAPGGYAYVAWMIGGLLASPGMALAGSAFAEGSHEPGSLAAVLSRAALAGLALTAAGSLVVALSAPWLLRIFGAGYAAEAAVLLRWLALAAPFVVLVSLYFTRLRVEKRIGPLIGLSGAVAALTLGLAAVLMPRYGIAASAVGWLAGNGLVAALALAALWRERVGCRPDSIVK
jgi:O-antigen/teichoic acid export membrane protein